jgi:hypothetical protein
MKPVYESGDVKVVDLTLYSPSSKAKATIIDQVQGFDLFEDISKPTMFAQFYMVDAIGILEHFPILGEELLDVEIVTPGMPSTAKYRFRVFAVSNVTRDDNGKSTFYTLKCVSEEHFNNAVNVQRTYSGVISEFVPDILKGYLKTRKPLYIEPTKGIQTVAIPMLSPLETIDMFRLRAVSSKYASSSFVFFENQQGFVFRTVESLIEEGASNIGSRIFNTDQNRMRDEYTDRVSYRSLLAYEHIRQRDVNQLLDQGAFSSVVRTFDLFKKQLTTVETQTPDIFSKFVTTDKQGVIPNTQQFIKEFGLKTQPFLVPKSSLVPDNFIKDVVAARNAFSVLLNSDITRVMINGDTGVKVGDVITLNLPESTGMTGRPQQDQQTTGNYLVIRLRHIVNISTE